MCCTATFIFMLIANTFYKPVFFVDWHVEFGGYYYKKTSPLSYKGFSRQSYEGAQNTCVSYNATLAFRLVKNNREANRLLHCQNISFL